MWTSRLTTTHNSSEKPLYSNMNLLPDLLSDHEISLYLRNYPQSRWTAVLRATILYGIASLRALQAAGLPVNLLEDQACPSLQALTDSMVPNIKGKLQRMKGQLDEISRCLGDLPLSVEEKLREEKAMARSNSVPARGKRGQPNQGKKDYGPLIYPDWWPMDTSSGSQSSQHPQPPPKRTVKPKVYTSKGRTPISTSQDPPKPPTKTIGTSTPLSHSSAKPLKLLVSPLYENPRQVSLRPELKQTRSQKAITPSSSESSRARQSVHSSEDTEGQRMYRNDTGTVKRGLGTTWAGDFTKVVKRSPENRTERSSQESRGKTSLSELRRKREDDREGVKLDLSSDSSISTYHPSEELKAFYRNEHDRLCPKPSPRQTPQVSVSAQFYRSNESSARSGSELAEDRDSDSFARY